MSPGQKLENANIALQTSALAHVSRRMTCASSRSILIVFHSNNGIGFGFDIRRDINLRVIRAGHDIFTYIFRTGRIIPGSGGPGGGLSCWKGIAQ